MASSRFDARGLALVSKADRMMSETAEYLVQWLRRWAPNSPALRLGPDLPELVEESHEPAIESDRVDAILSEGEA